MIDKSERASPGSHLFFIFMLLTLRWCTSEFMTLPQELSLCRYEGGPRGHQGHHRTVGSSRRPTKGGSGTRSTGHPAFPYGLDGRGGEGIICAHLEVVKAALLINDLAATVCPGISNNMNLFSPASWR